MDLLRLGTAPTYGQAAKLSLMQASTPASLSRPISARLRGQRGQIRWVFTDSADLKCQGLLAPVLNMAQISAFIHDYQDHRVLND